MLDPYENVLIGNFLYSLGARTAARCLESGLQVQGVVSLLQQTPLDGPLGDVCLTHPGTIRLLEFKRSGNRSPKESRKLARLRIALKGREYVGLEMLSRRVHWYVESIEADPVWYTRARPYLDQDAPSARDLNIGQLTDDLAAAAVGTGTPEFPAEAIALYLKALAEYAGAKGTSSSGIVVAVDKTGVVRWLPLQSLNELRLTLAQHRAVTRQLVAEMGRARDMAIEAERALEVKAAQQRQLKIERDIGDRL